MSGLEEFLLDSNGAEIVVQGDEEEERMTWKGWRNKRKEALVQFLEPRLLGTQTDDDDDDDNDNGNEESKHPPVAADADNDNNNDDDDEPESQQLETQQQPGAYSGLHQQQQPTTSSIRTTTIPWIRDAAAVHAVVSYSADLDLQTRVLSLGLVRVEKFWKLRETKRSWQQQQQQSSSATVVVRKSTTTNNNTTALDRFFAWHGGGGAGVDGLEDDGPLGTCYRRVLALQVVQEDDSSSSSSSSTATTIREQVRQRAERVQQHTTTSSNAALEDGGGVVASKKRLFIFLYCPYADAVHAILQKKKRSTTNSSSSISCIADDLFVALDQIPARCIFPSPQQASDWYAREHVSECCVCIGGKSSVKLLQHNSMTSPAAAAAAADNNNNNNESNAMTTTMVRQRFDNEHLRFSIGWSETTTTGKKNVAVLREWALHQDQQQNGGGTVGVSTSQEMQDTGPIALEYYKRWKRQPAPPPQRKPPPTAAPEQQQQQQQHPNNHTNGVRRDDPAEQELEPSKKRPRTNNSNANGVCSSNDAAAESRSDVANENTKAASSSSRTATLPSSSASPPPPQQGRTNGDGGGGGGPNRAPPPPPPRGQRSGPPGASRTSTLTPRKTRPTYDRLDRLLGKYETHKNVSILGYDRAKPINGDDRSCLTNVFAVALGFGAPSQTKRGDWMVGVALIDDSLPLPPSVQKSAAAAGDGEMLESAQLHAININIFTKNKDELPNLCRAGDVLRLHRVKVQEWKGEIQLLGMRSSSYVVFHNPTIPPTANHQYEMTPQDENRFKELWEWAQNRLLVYPTMKLSQSFKLCDMKRQGNQEIELFGDQSARGDLTAMVSAILLVQAPAEHLTGVTPRGFLRIWDGTGPPESDPLPHSALGVDAAVVRNGDPPSQALERIASIINKLRSMNHIEESSLQPPKAVTGRVVNVAVWEDSHWNLVSKAVSIGSFIRLRNVQDSKLNESGLRCLMLSSKSYLTPLPDLTFEVIRVLHDHNERLTRGDAINPTSGILPLDATQCATAQAGQERSDREEEQASIGEDRRQEQRQTAANGSVAEARGSRNGLQEILVLPPPSTFSGSVRIIDTVPPLSSLQSSRGFQQILCSVGNGEQSYRFAIRVSDESADLKAVVSDASGSALMGMPATAALRNSSGALLNLQKVIEASSFWEARIRSLEIQSTKYFFVETIKEAR